MNKTAMNRDEIIAANPIADFVGSRGHKLIASGDNFITAACPVGVHKKPGHYPVTIDVAKQVWHCNDHKVGGSIIDWIKTEKNISAINAMRELGVGENKSRARKEFVCAYDYTDESGNLLFQAVRYKLPSPENKTFSQRQPNGKGGWIWNLKGVRRVLYRLREVIAAQTVIVVEGEKNADDLAALGFVATTNVFGAGKWHDEYSETLRGKDVVVFGDIGDPDQAGERHTQKVLLSLAGKAGSLKHAIQPNGFHDVSDWIAALPKTEAREAIQRLINEAPLIDQVDLWRQATSAEAEPENENNEAATIARLAALSLIEYDRIRKAEADKLGCRESTLDSLVQAKRLLMRPSSDGESLQGTSVKLADVEPWPDPVDGAEILDRVATRLEHYVVLPEGAADILALWCAHTHLFKLFQKSPRLYISAPTEECGKSTLLNCCSLFGARAKRTDNMTTAVMFRLVAGHSPTILADECDKWLFSNLDLVGLVQSGAEKGGTVMRCEGDSNDLREFGCYAPVALAAIGKLPSQLHSRSIIIQLERAQYEEIKKCALLDFEHVEYETELNRKLARWTSDNRGRIASCAPNLPKHLFNRIADNWRPLFKIAEVAGDGWSSRCANALAKLSSGGGEKENLRVMLLSDIQKVFSGEWPTPLEDQSPVQIERIFSKDLIDNLEEMKERPWPEICRGKPITQRWLARNLAAFGIQSHNIWDGKNQAQAKGYESAQFDKVFARYIPDNQGDTPASPSNRPNTMENAEKSSVQKENAWTDEKEPVYEAIGRMDGCTDGVPPKKGKL
jgi:5S rRNA maturation endonuclease (ribonuclease M5)